MFFDKKVQNKSFDGLLFALFLILIFVGFVMLMSSSVIIADKKFGDKFYFIKNQLFKGIIPAIILFIGFSYVRYQNIKKYSTIIFGVSILLMILVLIPGIGQYHGGSRSWIQLGPLSFQPAEIIKLTSIIFLAALFEKIGKYVNDMKEGMSMYLIVFGVVSLLLLLQPDLGTMSIFFVICNAMFFIAGARFRYIAIMIGGGFLLLAIFLKIDNGGSRTERINVFLHPEQYSMEGVGYHVDQAMIAVGTGGVFGRGIGRSVQKFSYLPEVIADSIFAVMAEELGFILTVCVIGVYFLFLYRSITVANNSPDNFSKYFVSGVVVWIGMQVFVNIGAMIRLFPLTGVTLPLASYGSTSMWVVAIACGIVLNISRYSKADTSGKLVKKRNTVLSIKE